MIVVPFADGLALQIARPLDEVDGVLDRLRWILLAIALGGSGLAALLGLAVAQSALVPTRRLTEAAEDITATQDLRRRVDTDRKDELGRLAVAFNTMLAALEDSVEAQRRLVSDASHELRTPLTSLRTNVEILGKAESLPDDERRRLLDDVDAELDELSRLIADVVDLARDGEPERIEEDIRLDQLVADAVERARRRAPEVAFETALDETVVHGSRERLHRAVSNLLDNAVKWSPDGGTVEVRVADAAVSIRDHGPGHRRRGSARRCSIASIALLTPAACPAPVSGSPSCARWPSRTAEASARPEQTEAARSSASSSPRALSQLFSVLLGTPGSMGTVNDERSPMNLNRLATKRTLVVGAVVLGRLRRSRRRHRGRERRLRPRGRSRRPSRRPSPRSSA